MEKLSQQLYCNVRVLENVENLNQCSSNTLLHIIRFFVTPTLFSIWYGYPPHTVVSSDGTLEKRALSRVQSGKTTVCAPHILQLTFFLMLIGAPIKVTSNYFRENSVRFGRLWFVKVQTGDTETPLIFPVMDIGTNIKSYSWKKIMNKSLGCWDSFWYLGLISPPGSCVQKKALSQT